MCTGGYSGVMEAASRGAKEAGGRTLAVTAKFFRSGTNVWVDKEYAVDTWQERLFELIRLGHGFAACKGGTGTLVELAVVWEMLNKGVIAGKPFVTLGEFWTPILDRVREVEMAHHGSRRGEAAARLIHVVSNSGGSSGLFGPNSRGESDPKPRLRRQLRKPGSAEAPVSRPAEQILEFDRLRDLLRGRTTSAPGRRAVDALSFGTDRARLEREFAAIAEAVAYLRTGSELGFGGLADPQPWLARIEKPGAVLQPGELLNVASLIDTAAWLGVSFSRAPPEIPSAHRARPLAGRFSLAGHGDPSRDPAKRRGQRRCIKRAAAHPRRPRRARAKRSRTTLERILRARGEPQGEDYVTRRNDRFVIPVRASDRRAVQGVVHAASATGQTVFVEPLETIELNNRLVQLADEETTEIARILGELTGRVADERAPALARRGKPSRNSILCLRGPASRANSTPACQCLRIRPTIALEVARHPVLENTLRAQGRAVVPLTLSLGGDETVLVISGPNTGGKTVALKTVGLAVLAAQSGIPVAAESARLPVFDQVLADIGDEQSISADLSTFSAHVLNLKSMLASLTERSLVLVDEMGTGTAPEEGAALAVALLEEFRARRCLVLATTHHDRHEGLPPRRRPACSTPRWNSTRSALRPRIACASACPAASSGIAIARRLGLPESIVERASALITPEAREAAGLIAYLHRSRNTLEQMQRELAEQIAAPRAGTAPALREEKWVERQRKPHRRARAARRRRLLAQHERDVGRALETVKDRELRRATRKADDRRSAWAEAHVPEARGEADAAVVAHLSESQARPGRRRPRRCGLRALDALVPGARLRVSGFSAPVVLLRRDASNAEVQAGPLRMKVPLAEITAIVADEPAKAAEGSTGRRLGKRTAGVGVAQSWVAARRAPRRPSWRHSARSVGVEDAAADT